MIETLKYVVVFNTTGRTLKNQINFKPGLTVIKGENEAGKSFVLEMIRYALFGSDALRGARADYEKLEVKLVVSIKGKRYTIERKGSKATVNINEAVGTTATNKFIKKLLGFDLSVFDITANAKQGKLDQLTENMGPSERRKMVDQVTGLSQFEEVEKQCREEANAFRRIVEALESQLVEPMKPEQPDDYEAVSVLQSRLDQENEYALRRRLLEPVDEPIPPTPLEDQSHLAQHEQDRKSLDKQRASLEAQLAALPEAPTSFTRLQLDKMLRWYEQDSWGPRPLMTPSHQLENWRHDHILRSPKNTPVRCPHCQGLLSGMELPNEPPMTMAEIDAEISAQTKWEGHWYESVPEPALSKEDALLALAGIEAQPERILLEKQLQNLPVMEDLSAALATWEQYVLDMAGYERDVILHNKYLEERRITDAFPEPEPLLREKLELATRYDMLIDKYETAQEIYSAQYDKILIAQDKRDGFKRGSEALKDIRKDVKQYLIPSLAKVSSALLAEMTDGQRKSIVIDEDFEIYVDKQPVRTLSGSGISVVNLALRVALGQVLTQSVIPIFLADEIDANMAEKRTKATHESLHRLKKKLSQIIVVTHKNLEGDHLICLS